MAPVLLTASLFLNIALIVHNLFLISPSHKASPNTTTPQCVVPVSKSTVELYTPQDNKERAKKWLDAATRVSAKNGEGYTGWLMLLAAVDIDPTNVEAISNLVNNYEQVNYHKLGFSELMAANLTTLQRDQIMAPHARRKHETAFHQLQVDFTSKPLPPLLSFTSAFETLYGTWDLRTLLPPTLNRAIYDIIVSEYENLKTSRPDIANNATELNHALFRVQMSKLDKSLSYWGSLSEVEGFKLLVALMRRTAMDFLQRHGWSNMDAARKSAHPLVVWLSVHTSTSVHQPHVTADALVGGVYYINIPPNSGRLEMYDPRGKHPLHDLKDPTSPWKVNPPFHRVHGIHPKESMLVLFPGWCVHSVLSTTTTTTTPLLSSETPNYRVSLSLNLKGEWQDTVVSHRLLI